MEAIILAGGLGTRLQALTVNMPKPMLPISDRPFLEYILDYLVKQNISRAILSVGYQGEQIEDHFGNDWYGMSLLYAYEKIPLGTGGAIKNCLDLMNEDEFFIINGDTFFLVPLQDLKIFHHKYGAELTMALKPMKNFERYGNVLTSNMRICGFDEKRFTITGNINGGIYFIDKLIFERFALAEKFSLEKELFELHVDEIHAYGYVSNAYFIDIGIPDDYKRAQYEITEVINANSLDKEP